MTRYNTSSLGIDPTRVSGITSNGANPVYVVFSNTTSFGGQRSRTLNVGPVSFGPYGVSNVASVDPGDVFSNGFVSDKRIFYSSGIFIPPSV